MYRATGVGGESMSVKFQQWGAGARRHAVAEVRSHLKCVAQLGGQYVVRHVEEYWGGGSGFDGDGMVKPGGTPGRDGDGGTGACRWTRIWRGMRCRTRSGCG